MSYDVSSKNLRCFTGAPTINNPLIDQVIEVNERVTLNCKASGDGTITYQWQQFSNGSWMDIADSNNAEYTTDMLTQSSQFRCVVTNEAGMALSDVTIFVLSKENFGGLNNANMLLKYYEGIMVH